MGAIKDASGGSSENAGLVRILNRQRLNKLRKAAVEILSATDPEPEQRIAMNRATHLVELLHSASMAARASLI